MEEQKLFTFVYRYLKEHNYTEETAMYANLAAGILGVLIVAFVMDLIIRRILIALARRISLKTKNKFDDFLISNRTFASDAGQ